MNPWVALPDQAPWVLAEDGAVIEAFNQNASVHTRIDTSLLPEPVVGRIDAPVLLLLLNPGAAEEDARVHAQASFRRAVLRCHRQTPCDYPNYYLDPNIDGGGARWSRRVLRPLLDVVGERTVANGVAYIEYFPYHSRKFGHHRLRVPSQRFTWSLVRQVIERGAVLFVTRGRALWEEAVPELRGYERAFTTRSVQNVVLSPRNTPDGYAAAVEVLERLR